jgi:hypothetical protein
MVMRFVVKLKIIVGYEENALTLFVGKYSR